jgi:hypothetical protein
MIIRCFYRSLRYFTAYLYSKHGLQGVRLPLVVLKKPSFLGFFH